MLILRQLLVLPLVLALLNPCFAAEAQIASRGLRIIPLEGNGVTNYIPIPTVTAPVVEVRDSNDRPVKGATVVFKLPASGPGAFFGNHELTQTAVTDINGQAGATGYTINGVPGRFAIQVTATYQGQTAQFTMTQTNTMQLTSKMPGGPKSSSKKKWIIIGAIAAGGAVAAILATRGSGKPSTVSVSTGPVVIGNP